MIGKTKFSKKSGSGWERAMSNDGGKAPKLFPEVSDIERGIRKNPNYTAGKRRR